MGQSLCDVLRTVFHSSTLLNLTGLSRREGPDLMIEPSSGFKQTPGGQLSPTQRREKVGKGIIIHSFIYSFTCQMLIQCVLCQIGSIEQWMSLWGSVGVQRKTWSDLQEGGGLVRMKSEFSRKVNESLPGNGEKRGGHQREAVIWLKALRHE